MNATRMTRGSNGFTLVEVLVTLLVLSIGLLGIDKLLLVSSRANDSAYMRTQATALAYSILDSMRANRQTAVSGAYNGSSSSATNPNTLCPATAPCSGSTIAQYDLWQWKQALAAELPSGSGTITTTGVADSVTNVTDTTATITVTWDDSVAQRTFGAGGTGNVTITLETVL